MKTDKQQPPVLGPDATLPKLLKAAVSTRGKSVWMRKKMSGLWHQYSWQECYDKVRHFSLGLTSLGFERGQTLCIVGDNDPQWFWAEIAGQAAGGSVVAADHRRSAEDLKAVMRQFGVRIAVVQDREQVDKLLQIKSDVPSLVKVIFWNAKGVENYQDPLLMHFESVAKTGEELDASRSGAFEEAMRQVRRADVAVIQCGSVDSSVVQSTTLTHDNLLAAIAAFSSTCPFNTRDRWFSCTPPEGTVEQVLGLCGSLVSGMSLDFPENRETAQQDLREVGSTLVCFPSPFWEGLSATVKDRIAKTTLVKRMISRMASPVGSRMAEAGLDGRKPGIFLRATRAIADFGFYRPLRARTGLANTRCVYAFGGKLTPDALKVLLDMGLDMRELDLSGGMLSVRQRVGTAIAKAAG